MRVCVCVCVSACVYVRACLCVNDLTLSSSAQRTDKSRDARDARWSLSKDGRRDGSRSGKATIILFPLLL
jgi:hypothetical protein